MQGAKDLIASERGAFAVLIVLVATLLTVLRILAPGDWKSLVIWTVVTLVISKTASTGVDQFLGNSTATGAPVTPPTSQT